MCQKLAYDWKFRIIYSIYVSLHCSAFLQEISVCVYIYAAAHSTNVVIATAFKDCIWLLKSIETEPFV